MRTSVRQLRDILEYAGQPRLRTRPCASRPSYLLHSSRIQPCQFRLLNVEAHGAPADITRSLDAGVNNVEKSSRSASTVFASNHDRPDSESRPSRPFQQTLPITCPGCGALSQESTAEEAGFYTRSRKAVKSYLRSLRDRQTNHEPLIQESGGVSVGAKPEQTRSAGHSLEATYDDDTETRLSPTTSHEIPVCDRCHDLMYNSRGTSIAHPTLEAIADSISESPFRRNHVYHVIDSADFPMSLIPSIYRSLSLAKPRSQNRRSQHDFSRRPTLSFIITRSDLLAPNKEMVDSLMPYVTSVLREALGRFAQDMRLGNVHLVSAKRGWWTTDIKESIWKRGGGNWMVGKVNVGKSNLFEVLFPKGSGERAPSYAELELEVKSEHASSEESKSYDDQIGLLSETALLPPPQPETAFPTLPLVSSLPGTTASPIRLPFGKHKGELIDLPGLARGNLEDFVQPEHKLSLVMTHRPTVTQHIIKPGQSLLIGGGLVRITPLLDEADPSTTMLAYPFVPLPAHVTSTEKAIGAQTQIRESHIKTILADGAGERIKMAGKFRLDTDVTKSRAKALIAAGVPLEKLPFRVYSTDILVEGVGWIELVCQTRTSKGPSPPPISDTASEIHHTTWSGERPFPPPIPGLTSLEVQSSSFEGKNSGRAKLETSVYQGGEVRDALSHLEAAFQDPAGRSRKTAGSSAGLSTSPFPEVEIHSPNGGHIGTRKPMGAWLLLEAGRRRKAKNAAAGARPRKSMKGAEKRERTERRSRDVAADA